MMKIDSDACIWCECGERWGEVRCGVRNMLSVSCVSGGTVVVLAHEYWTGVEAHNDVVGTWIDARLAAFGVLSQIIGLICNFNWKTLSLCSLGKYDLWRASRGGEGAWRELAGDKERFIEAQLALWKLDWKSDFVRGRSECGRGEIEWYHRVWSSLSPAVG